LKTFGPIRAWSLGPERLFETLEMRRMRARGLQDSARVLTFCKAGPLTGRVFKQALREKLAKTPGTC